MPTVIDLGELGLRGFIIEGDAASDIAGNSISAAGDVNGDGFDDFIIGAPFNDSGGTNAGAAYVIFGKADGLGSFDLTNLQPSQGFKIQGDEAGDYAGWAVSAAGDVNGDGFDDIIVGSIYYSYYYAGTPHAYVIFGKTSGFGTIDLTDLAPTTGFVMAGEIATFSTFSVAGAGDVNGDGFDDVIIGSSYDNDTAGAAYVIFGKASGFGPIDLTNLAPSTGFEIEGDAAHDRVGHSVAGAGDINGDGFDDLIIGAPLGFGEGSGADAYVIFGSASITTIDLTNLTASQGFRIQANKTPNWAGATVAGAGDINGDGFDDLLVADTSGSAGGTDAGQVYVIFGHAGGFNSVDLANLGSSGFVIQGDAAGDLAGHSAAGAGDVNGDGFDDIIIGAPNGDNGAQNAGEAYVIFGHAGTFGTIDLTNLDPAVGFIVQGSEADAQVALSVAGAGDIDGDGFADLLIGNPLAFHGVNEEGRVYVVFGEGTSVFAGRAGDFNGDGRDDILWRHDNGQVANWLGQPDGGFVSNANANAGTDWHVASIGDFNGDGRDDVLWRNDNGDLTDWLGQAGGSFASNFGNAFYQVNTSWEVAGTGDFNGDGRDDILWRHQSGQVLNWLGQANGSFVSNANANAGTDWHVAGTGDFNGDNRDDVLWRNNNGDVTEWLGQANGSFASNFENGYYQVATGWQVAGTGDFNGDGRDDILWRHDSGQVLNWLGQTNGGFVSNANANAGTDWHIVSIGDFNGDGRDDVLWRNNNGDLTNWLGQANGSFASNFENANYQVDNRWDVQPNPSGAGDWDY